MIEAIGTLGVICFAFCALPQAYECIKNKHADGVSSAFLGMWLIGELSMIFYSAAKPLPNILLYNYLGNLLCLIIIIHFKIKGRQ